MTATKDGAELRNYRATHGTVRLVVDHQEEHYEVKVSALYMYEDMQEVTRYLAEHDFELLPEHECPVEYNADGSFSVWAAHKCGLDFGYVTVGTSVKVMIAGVAAALSAFAVQLLSEPIGVITEGLFFP